MHWLQLLILINFLLLVISLFSSLFVLYREKGEGLKTFYALSIRVTLAVSLLVLVGFGVATGQIGSHAPWDRFPASQSINVNHSH
ncbi:MAG: DUF2909 domain-containing protein [Cellvibrionales bacterium]|nr:DUF2909 domain-containing protein [Cellvibrionales bacterium]